MSAQVVKMQSYRDYKDGLITKEEMIEGKTYSRTMHISARTIVKSGEELLRAFNAFRQSSKEDDDDEMP